MRLLWIHVPGLDADTVLDRIKSLPSIRRLLKRGSIGHCELNAVAFADVAEQMIRGPCEELDLPWQEGLSLERLPQSLLNCVAAMPIRTAIVSMNRGDSSVENHKDICHEDLSLAWANVVMAAMQLQARDPEMLFVELAGIEHISSELKSPLLSVFDATIRELSEGINDNVHVLMTSPFSLHKYPVTFGLNRVTESCGFRILGSRISGDRALLELAEGADFQSLKNRLHGYKFSNGVEPVAELRLINKSGRNFVHVFPFRGVGLSQASKEVVTGGYELASYGVALLSGPRVRRGALISLDWVAIPKLVRLICREPESMEQVYPYFGDEIGPDMLAKFVWEKYE